MFLVAELQERLDLAEKCQKELEGKKQNLEHRLADSERDDERLQRRVQTDGDESDPIRNTGMNWDDELEASSNDDWFSDDGDGDDEDEYFPFDDDFTNEHTPVNSDSDQEVNNDQLRNEIRNNITENWDRSDASSEPIMGCAGDGQVDRGGTTIQPDQVIGTSNISPSGSSGYDSSSSMRFPVNTPDGVRDIGGGDRGTDCRPRI